MASEWFYKFMGEEIGPVSSVKLRDLAQRGTVTPGTPVRKAPDSDWVPAECVRGLFAASDKTPTRTPLSATLRQRAGEFPLPQFQPPPGAAHPAAPMAPLVPSATAAPGVPMAPRAAFELPAAAASPVEKRLPDPPTAPKRTETADLLRLRNELVSPGSSTSPERTDLGSMSKVSGKIICCYVCKKNIADNAQLVPSVVLFKRPKDGNRAGGARRQAI